MHMGYTIVPLTAQTGTITALAQLLIDTVTHRGRGMASALLREAERTAAGKGRTLLTLDTAEQEGAAGLYKKMGYQRTGVIPDYALMPYGGLTGTIVYWKRIG